MWLLVGIALATNWPARAQTVRETVIVVVGHDAGVAAELVPLLEARGLPVRFAEPRAETVEDETPSLVEARRAYDNLDPTAALAILDAMFERLRASGGAGLDRDGLISAFALRALASLAPVVARDDLVADSLRRLLAVDPAAELDEAHYPPALRARLEAERAAITRATLAIEGVPDDARVFLDGLEIDAREVEVAGGVHFVRAEGPRVRPAGREVEVRERTSVELALVLDPEAVFRDPPEDARPLVARAAREVGVGAIVLRVDDGAGAISAVLSDAFGPRVARARGANATLVARELARAWTERGAVEPDDDSTAVTWIAIGSAVAAVVIAGALTVVLLASDGQEGATLRLWP